MLPHRRERRRGVEPGAGDDEGAGTGHQRGMHAHERAHVEQRRREHDRPRLVRVPAGAALQASRVHIQVREHRALGPARRPGGVEDRVVVLAARDEHVVRVQGRTGRRDVRQPGGALEDDGPVGRRRGHPHRRGPGRVRLPVAAQLGDGGEGQVVGRRLGHEEARGRVAQDVGDLAGAQAEVHGHGDRAQRDGRLDDREELRAIRHEDGDAVAGPHAAVAQVRRGPQDGLHVVGPGRRSALEAVGGAVGDLVRVAQ